MQIEGPHTRPMQKTSTEILFLMRARRNSDKTLPFVDGKCKRGRREGGRKDCFDPLIKLTPRPHTTIRLGKRTFNALVDGESEISLINPRTAKTLVTDRVTIREDQEEIQLADGSIRPTLGTIRLRTGLHNRTLTHSFTFLPDMEDEVILGIDGQAKFKVGILPSPRSKKKRT